MTPDTHVQSQITIANNAGTLRLACGCGPCRAEGDRRVLANIDHEASHATPHVSAWMGAHRDPKFRPPKNRFPYRSRPLRLTPKQRDKIEAELAAMRDA